MTIRVYTLLSFLAAATLTMAAQTEPVLTSANIPKYPPLAAQARVEGIVKLSFRLEAGAAEPTNVEVVSGHPLLKRAALENVKTWRFENPFPPVERKYETTFKYRLSDRKAVGKKKVIVTFESFDHVEILTDVPTIQY